MDKPKATSRPKVSVVIITYNHEDFIADAIEGALMQETDFPYEIIIGEDESKDATREICIDYAERYPDKIRLFLRSREDVIYINGRPTGRYNFVESLKAARGEYVALCDGDDYWTDRRKLQKQVDFLDSHPSCSACFTKAKRVRVLSAARPIDLVPPGEQRTYTFDDLLTEANFIPTCSVMFRNGLLGQFPDWYFGMPQGDWPLHLMNAQYGDVGYIDEATAVHRLHAGCAWSTRDLAEDLLSRIESREVVQRSLRLNDSQADRIESARYVLSYRLVNAHVQRDDLAKARHYLWWCIRHRRYGRRVPRHSLIKLALGAYCPHLYELGSAVRQWLFGRFHMALRRSTLEDQLH